MKIGIFIDDMSAKGGQVRVVANLCHAWAAAGWDVHLITSGDEECGFPIPGAVRRHSLLRRSRRTGIFRYLDNISLSVRLGRLSRQLSLDGLLAISAVESVILALSRCGSSVVKLGSEHVYSRHYPMPWLLGLCRRYLYPMLSGVVCPARKSAIALREDCPGVNAIHIPNLLIWPPGDVEDKNLHDLTAGRKRFITCGRLVFDKGFDVIIDAFAIIADKCDAWDLVIIGEGPAEEALRQRAAEKALRKRIIFTGYSDRADSYYKSSDVFVFASPQEGFGMVIAEAQASGLPAICFDCLAGPSDIVDHGKSGVMVPLGDVIAFSKSMQQLAEDAKLRQSMSRMAVDEAKKFGPDAIVPRWGAAFGHSMSTSSS
jgi:glycosyltransferase involved in cell wall biosynthesis